LEVIGIFGAAAVDLVVNPYTRAGSGQVEIRGSMFVDVGLRWPAAFGASDGPIATARRKAA
jgi:hypothetical protein